MSTKQIRSIGKYISFIKIIFTIMIYLTKQTMFFIPSITAIIERRFINIERKGQ